MPGSYRAVNYSLRPAKTVERKMLGEAFRRLYPFQRVEDYRYVGFGSIYFTDFQLMHCALGIDDMVSIEKDALAEECFVFNRPYRSIDLRFGLSGKILPQLSWDRRTILWLDYDGKLDFSSLGDVDTFCSRCVSGSALIVSVNAQPEAELADDARKVVEAETGEAFNASAYRLSKLKELIGDRVPRGTDGAVLRGKGLAQIFKRVIDSQIATQLEIRNSLLPFTERLVYRQIIHFLYKDGAQMLTVGGVLFKQGESDAFDACAFGKLHFVRSGDDAFSIRIPCLTTKEISHLNTQLPSDNFATLSAPGVPRADVAKYAEVYRYFPSFSEIVFG